jgi:hypothetical protein
MLPNLTHDFEPTLTRIFFMKSGLRSQEVSPERERDRERGSKREREMRASQEVSSPSSRINI